jgi:uncharacterized protein
MQLSHYIKIYPTDEDPDHYILYSTKRASSILLNRSTYDSIESGTLSDSNMETLSRLGFLVDDVNEEKASMLRILDVANESNRHLNAIVVLNLDCNLSCRYCYEGTLKGKHYMSRKTADSLVKCLKSDLESGKESLNIDYYGGEPLLSLDLIKYISGQINEYADKKNIEYTFTLVTNGTLLTRRIAEELSFLGLKGARITLDGIQTNHDEYRPYKSGTGSFDGIFRNIQDTCDIIGIGIGGNFNESNFRSFPLLLDHMLGNGLPPDRISYIKFDPISKTHNEQAPADFRDIGCDSINEPWLISASTMLRQEILTRGYNTPKITPAPCMIDIRGDFVANHDGSIYKCPGFLGTNGFQVGDLETGIQDYNSSHNINLWMNEKCLDCRYLPLCFGGCRYMKFLRDGDIDGMDCKKPYLDAVLETFLKQDIKYRMNSGK